MARIEGLGLRVQGLESNPDPSTWVAGGSLGGFWGGCEEARPKGLRRPKLPLSLSMTLGPLVDSMLARMPDWAAGTASFFRVCIMILLCSSAYSSCKR